MRKRDRLVLGQLRWRHGDCSCFLRMLAEVPDLIGQRALKPPATAHRRQYRGRFAERHIEVKRPGLN